MKLSKKERNALTSGSRQMATEMTRQINAIFDKLADPAEKDKARMAKQREEILQERMEDYNLN